MITDEVCLDMLLFELMQINKLLHIIHELVKEVNGKTA